MSLGCLNKKKTDVLEHLITFVSLREKFKKTTHALSICCH